MRILGELSISIKLLLVNKARVDKEKIFRCATKGKKVTSGTRASSDISTNDDEYDGWDDFDGVGLRTRWREMGLQIMRGRGRILGRTEPN